MYPQIVNTKPGSLIIFFYNQLYLFPLVKKLVYFSKCDILKNYKKPHKQASDFSKVNSKLKLLGGRKAHAH